MAKVTVYTDDLDSTVTDDVREFTVTVRDADGEFSERFTLDLGKVSAGKLHDALNRFRKVGTVVPFAPAASRDTDTGKIRAWAVANGHKVSERGALPNEVKDAYAAAHPEGEQGETETPETTDE